MTQVDVVWLSFHEGIDSRGPWDTGIMEELFANRLWPTGYTFVHHEIDHVPAGIDKAVVVLPARHHAQDAVRLNDELAKLTGVVLVLMGDEEAIFPWRQVKHPNMRLWVQLPHPEKHADLRGWAWLFGDGYKADTDTILADLSGEPRDIPWSFSGQVTHPRRQQAVNGLIESVRMHPGAVLTRTDGFARGMPRDAYLHTLHRTKIAPCPGGPHTPDTFRLFEALEAGCVPLADALAGNGSGWGYWDMLGWRTKPPFPIIDDWGSVAGQIELELADWPRNANRCSAWWTQFKYEMAHRMSIDLCQLGIEPFDPPCVIISTSPTAHPRQVMMLLETIASIPAGWPIMVAFDGVRPEQHHLAETYHQYVREAFDELMPLDRPFVGLVHDAHRHQANSVRQLLDSTMSRTILFMEHDTPLVRPDEIDWKGLVGLIEGGHFDVIRLHHEASILEPHEHLMLDHETGTWKGVPLRRTIQWSQRPHLASTGYYRAMLAKHFPTTARTMIEDKMHSVCQSEPYERNRLAIYHPDGNIKRSTHLDGRGDQPKFEMRYE